MEGGGAPASGERRPPRAWSRLRTLYLVVSPLPLAALWGARAYTSSLEGWGAWAGAAALGVWIVGASVGLALAGVLLAIALSRREQPMRWVLAAAALAFLPAALWIVS